LRIAVVGVGGVGGYYGARLAAGGHDVTFVARGANLEALRGSGLRVESALGDVRLREVTATDRVEAVGVVDAVLLCVKAYDIESVGPTLTPLVGPDTLVLCTQNGVDAMDRLAPWVPAGQVAGVVVYGNTVRRELGRVVHLGTVLRLELGGREGRARARAGELADAFAAAGVDAENVDDIDAALWSKFVMFSAMSAACCLTDQPTGPVRTSPNTRAMLERGMRETAAVASAKGVRLADDIVERSLEVADAMSPESTPSMLADQRAGRPLELDYLSGLVVRLGRELGVDVPFHEIAYAVLEHRQAGTAQPPDSP
jgi:2-dehydropantoate 2-reductase